MSQSLDTTSARMPTLYIPHGGGPCFFMDWNPPHAWDRMAAFLRGLAATLPQRPSAIVLVSGHWLEADFAVTGAAQPDLIYDYYGFPPHTYELTYPAPGAPALAARVTAALSKAGFGTHIDPVRGYDHGVFIPLKLVFPDADVPIIQLSLRRDMDAAAHLAVGRALAPLRDEGVLILGSGMSFHNMRAYGDPRSTGPSEQFDAWLTQTVEGDAERRDALLAQWDQAPSARFSHPPRAEEHLLPLMVAAGAAQGPGQRVFSDIVMATRVSAFRFD